MSVKTEIPIALAGLFALSACADFGVVVTSTGYVQQYEPAEVSAAGGGERQLQLTVLGTPFDAPREAVETAVIAIMQSTPTGVPVNYAISPTNSDPQRPYHVVVAFNPAGIRNPAALCSDRADVEYADPKNGTTTLMGALCSSDSFLSHAQARSQGVDGLNSAQFDTLVSQLTLALLRSRNPHYQDDGVRLLNN
jgi:hypothetical protein